MAHQYELRRHLYEYTKGHILLVSFVYTKGVNLFENLRPLVYDWLYSVSSYLPSITARINVPEGFTFGL